MAQIPEFPAVDFANVSQSAAEIRGSITLRHAGESRHARSICERFCPHHDGGRIDCSMIEPNGVAHITVRRSQSKIEWVRLRVARQFRAPCKVTYDAIRKTREPRR